jgi:hypothetical protein
MPGLGNVRPAGHMRPAKDLNVVRIIFWLDKTLNMPLKVLPFRKCIAKSHFSIQNLIKLVHMILLLARIDKFCFQCGP